MAKRLCSSKKIKSIALGLLRENQAGAAWREIGERLGVNYATVSRFANSRGEWVPKDEVILERLGLLTERSPYAVLPRYFKRTPEALAWFSHIKGLAKGIGEDTKRQQTGWRKR